MTDQHPITLPPKVLQQLRSKAPAEGWFRDAWIAEQAAQWGADMELEACCSWVAVDSITAATELRSDRRSKPPSLKEDALAVLQDIADQGPTPEQIRTIRRALESIKENND